MTNKEVQDITLESLRDWFKKEKWVRISSSGNIAGPCGTSKNKKNPDRCLPKAKAQSLTKGQRAATAAKKKKAGAKGKTVVKNTKKATVKKKNIAERLRFLSPEKQKANDAAFDRRMATLKDLEKGIKLHKAGKISDEELHNLKLKAGTISADSKFTEKNETKEAPAGHYFTKSGNLVKGSMSADAKERGARKSDPKDKQRSKVPPVSQTREDVRNLVVGLMHEIQNEGTIAEKDDRCTRLAKQKYDTWPSAYASGAVVRCRRGEIWKKK